MEQDPQDPKQPEVDPTEGEGTEGNGQGEGNEDGATVNINKFKRLEAKYEELKKQYEETSTKLSELSTSNGSVDELKKQIDELKTANETALNDANARFATAEKDHAIEAALLKAGCKDTIAARAHIDRESVTIKDGQITGLDVETLKKDRGYLFGVAAPAGTAGGGNPEGNTGTSTSDKIADVFGLKKKEG